MDFFLQQDRARSKTGLLVVLFIIAVSLVTLSVYAAIMGVILFNSTDPGARFFDPELFFTIAGVTFAVICIGSLIKIAALSKGGRYVAESLGGQLISPSTTEPDQRKLLNVVEEMAIASGTPVPPVYLLESEKGINAFAAGFSPNDAVIGVTAGCIRQLNREELQGVVAHEFSHILYGDMRLNIRLMGFLGGIMVIATIGETILRGSRHSSSSGSGKSGKGGGQIALISLLLLVIGYAGVMIGRLIQSAVCRQREYLADASAVQFTRSTGIAEALKKIGGFSSGSKIRSPGAGEACHMFISKAVSSLFATHPPLVDRIRRIDPEFSGDFTDSRPLSSAALTGEGPLSSFQSGQTIVMDPGTAMRQAGRIRPENVAYSAAILAAIPEPIKRETQDILGASALACALLLSRDPAQRQKQMDLLKRSASPQLVRQIETVEKSVRELAPGLRLPVLDTAIPALRQMSPEQFSTFKEQIQALIEADSRITVFEFAFEEIITHRLTAAFVDSAPKILYKNIIPLTEDAVILLSFLARTGHRVRETADKAFQMAVSALPIRGKETLMPETMTFQSLHSALERFSRASAGVKKTIFDACCQCVLFDGRASLEETELLRAVAFVLDIPMPPFIMEPVTGKH
ncbi:MAG: M48 family metallopeptidase [Thermodesulfobacteriota bacterium]